MARTPRQKVDAVKTNKDRITAMVGSCVVVQFEDGKARCVLLKGPRGEGPGCKVTIAHGERGRGRVRVVSSFQIKRRAKPMATFAALDDELEKLRDGFDTGNCSAINIAATVARELVAEDSRVREIYTITEAQLSALLTMAIGYGNGRGVKNSPAGRRRA